MERLEFRGTGRRAPILAAAMALAAASAGCAAVGARTDAVRGPAAAGADGSPAARTPEAGAAAPAPPPRPAPPPARAGAGRAAPRVSTLLVGTWRLADGSGGSEIVLDLGADGAWTLSGASYRARGTYRWLAAEELLETTVVSSNLDSETGAVVRRRVVVDERELVLGPPLRGDGGRRPDDAAGARRYRRVGGR